MTDVYLAPYTTPESVHPPGTPETVTGPISSESVQLFAVTPPSGPGGLGSGVRTNCGVRTSNRLETDVPKTRLSRLG